MTKLIVAFRNFAKASKRVDLQKASFFVEDKSLTHRTYFL